MKKIYDQELPHIRKTPEGWKVSWNWERSGFRRPTPRTVKSFKTACRIGRKWWNKDQFWMNWNKEHQT